MATTAAERGWGPGWPVDRRREMVRVSSSGISLWVNAGIAPLVGHLLDRTAAGGYALRPGECWGYACRPIRGSSRPSNHSWGLAVDLNSRTNPMGSALVTDLPRSVVEVWKSFSFRWGGDYTGRKDAMHFEFMGTPHDALLLSRRVAHERPPYPGAPLRRGSKGPDVRRVQQRVGVGADGEFGPRTEQAVRSFQSVHGLVADGLVGMRTWAALFA